MKKVLITYAEYGSGHKTIAGYIKNYFEEHSDYEIEVLNVTDYCNFVGKLGLKLFNFVVKHRIERVFDACYEMIDNRVVTKNQDRFAKISFDNKKIREKIINFNPDLTINCHFYGGNLVNYYNKKGLTHSKQISVLTDYVPHYCWLADRKDQEAFVVANEIVKRDMIEYGVDASKVYAYGIPLNKDRLLDLDDNEKIFKRYKLDKNKKTYILFGGGSNGVMSFYNYFKSIVKQEFDMNLIFICGKNVKLKQKSDEYVRKNKVPNTLVMGFTTDVFNLLKIADCVISKSGAATITECIEMNVPIIAIPGVGGQEKYNARFVKLHGFGTKVRTYRNLNKVIKRTLDNPDVLAKWKHNMEKEEDNNSIVKILKLAQKLLK